MSDQSAEGTYLVTAIYEISGRDVVGEVLVEAPTVDRAVHSASEEINFPPDADVQVEEVEG